MKVMADHIQVEDHYLNALGRAFYNYTYLELCIVRLTECIDEGFKFKAEYLTAGMISKHFLGGIERLPEEDKDKEKLRNVYSKFEKIIDRRNGLIHSRPFLTLNGKQELHYCNQKREKYVEWSIDDMIKLAEDIAHLSAEATLILHDGKHDDYIKSVRLKHKIID